MALVDVPLLYFPQHTYATSSPSAGNTTVDADREGHGYIAEIPPGDDGKTIEVVSYSSGSSHTTNGPMDARVETVDGSGDPSGTLAAANTNLETTITGASQHVDATLTAGYTVSAREMLAIIAVRPSSGTFEGTLLSVRNQFQGADGPSYATINTGSWTPRQMAATGQFLFSMAVRYSDGSYLQLPGMTPAATGGNDTFNNGGSGTGLERGLKFQLPYKCAVNGCWLSGAAEAAGADYRIALYNLSAIPDEAGANRLAVGTVDGDHQVATSDLVFVHFDSVVTLEKSTVYRVTIDALTASNVGLRFITTDSAGLMAAVPGGINLVHTLDNGAGDWTDTDTKRPLMGLILSQIDDGAGGAAVVEDPPYAGGVVTNPIWGA